MLLHLQIKDFTLIDNLDHSLLPGMTVMTGETGAGKSIILDALSLVLGGRATAKLIRPGAERCEISGMFSLNDSMPAKAWLTQQELLAGDECILRRIISSDGRSKAFINGTPVTLQQLKTVANYFINIHGQHENQSLMNHDIQRQMLDAYANHPTKLTAVNKAYQQWHDIHEQIIKLDQQQQDYARQELLAYQLAELEQLELVEGEVSALEQEYKMLAGAQTLLYDCQQCLTLLADDDRFTVSAALMQAIQKLQPHITTSPTLKNISQTLDESLIQIQESEADLRDSMDSFQEDPERLQTIEQRLSLLHTMARKHKCRSDELINIQTTLSQQHQTLQQHDGLRAQLGQRLQDAKAHYEQVAKILTDSRKKAATKLSKLVTQNMQTLNMAQGKFSIAFLPTDDQQPRPQGNERIEYHVSPNPGTPAGALHKIASGGELSRISLAIQVIIAQCYQTPVLIFDEVDVGIGGATAEIVGKLLKELSSNAQVLCITHLPQVAALADHHVMVHKKQTKHTTSSDLTLLSAEQRVDEIARMLGGIKITEQTRKYATEMLTPEC